MSQYNDLIETLGETASASHFFSLATQQLSRQLDVLVERVFRKQNFALKSVVDSLFEHQGPLADKTVRLKVLLGLGVISAELYQDLLAFFEFTLPQKEAHTELGFSHPAIIAFAKSLHQIDPHLFQRLAKLATSDDPSSLLYQMQQQRIENMLRSALILRIIEMLEQLDVESPF